MQHSIASGSTDDPSRTKTARTKVSILEIGQCKRCNASAKAAILQDVKQLGRLDLHHGLDRRSLRRERTATAPRTTDFGPLHLAAGIQDGQWARCIPCAESTGDAVPGNEY